MDAINVIVSNIQAASDGLIPILYGLVVAAGLDVLSGVWAAWRSGTFDSTFLPTFISTHVVQRIAPIGLVLLAGVSVGGTDSAAGLALVATGAAAGAAYLAAVVASITDNLTSGVDRTKEAPSVIEPVVISTQSLTDNAKP